MRPSLVDVVLTLCGLIPTSFATVHPNESKVKLMNSRSHHDGTRIDVPRVLLGSVETRGNSERRAKKGISGKGGKKGNYGEGDKKGGLGKGGKKGRAGSVGKKGRYGSGDKGDESQTPPSTYLSTAPSSQPIHEFTAPPTHDLTDSPASHNQTAHPTPATLPPISDDCVSVEATCIPPIDPADPQGGRFEDCNSINIDPAVCTEAPTLLTFRFVGGDCLDSNNIFGPNFFTCEDFFDGPPPSDDFTTEAYMIIIDNEGVKYFDGSIKVGDEFNITNFAPFLAAVNVTVYDGTPAPENIRETMIISTTCSEATYLKDRFGVLQFIGFSNPSQGYQQGIIPVSYDFSITSSSNAVLESLYVIQNLDPQKELLNFTDNVFGIELNAGDAFVLSSGPINIDLSIHKPYNVSVLVRATYPSGFSCRAFDFDTLNFNTEGLDTSP